LAHPYILYPVHIRDAPARRDSKNAFAQTPEIPPVDHVGIESDDKADELSHVHILSNNPNKTLKTCLRNVCIRIVMQNPMYFYTADHFWLSAYALAAIEAANNANIVAPPREFLSHP
jgi:hypothetical protein